MNSKNNKDTNTVKEIQESLNMMAKTQKETLISLNRLECKIDLFVLQNQVATDKDNQQ